FSSRRRHTRLQGDWSSDVCSSDLEAKACERFLARQEQLLADPSRLSSYPPPPPLAKVDPRVAQRVPGLPLVLGVAPPLPPVAPSDNPRGRAREYLIHALLNHNDFITIR